MFRSLLSILSGKKNGLLLSIIVSQILTFKVKNERLSHNPLLITGSIGGLMAELPPTAPETRVQFPANAHHPQQYPQSSMSTPQPHGLTIIVQLSVLIMVFIIVN